jgi:hypothetical protein
MVLASGQLMKNRVTDGLQGFDRKRLISTIIVP